MNLYHLTLGTKHEQVGCISGGVRMSRSGKGSDDLSKLSVTDLAQAYVESVQAAEATEHVGRKNRLAGQRWKIVQELKARGRGEARPVLERLAGHPDAQVRAWAKGNLDWVDSRTPDGPSKQVSNGRYWPQIQWQCDHPPPPALTRDEIAERLRASVPEACDRLMDLALPAIGLWPQRRAEIATTALRFGGMPLAPTGWQWPVNEEEPRLFVGQINCAELRGLPGAELLPSSGLLSFFGDHDAVEGCFPFDDHCVFYWPDVGRLVPAMAPIDPLNVFPLCALAPHPLVDLPHPFSRAVRKVGLNEQQQKLYHQAWLEVRQHGIPRDCVAYTQFSKLFGWPALVQGDLDQFESNDEARLLLQADAYCNGEDFHGWGPGGSLFYVIPRRDLRAHNFARCQLEGQFT